MMIQLSCGHYTEEEPDDRIGDVLTCGECLCRVVVMAFISYYDSQGKEIRPLEIVIVDRGE